jgi:membrane-bound lytic murein transglycosylase MltF
VPDPANVSEEQLLAAIAYGESHWSNVYEEMAAIASATVRKKEAKGYKTVNELILKNPRFFM